jgi:hypothetical protein
MNLPTLTDEDYSWGEQLRHHLSEVIIVASSSRGGSSVFTEYLRHSSALLHLRGEFNPWLHMCNLAYPHSLTGSDRLDESHVEGKEDELWAWLGTEIGNFDWGTEAWKAFPNHLKRRLQLQWPSENIQLKHIVKAVETIQNKTPELMVAMKQAPEQFHLALIRHLQNFGYSNLYPHWYDISGADLKSWGWDLEKMGPIPYFYEEPPFVLITPWKKPTLSDLKTKPLIIKTPSNAYRLPFLLAFFKSQNVRLIHLKREPADAINGLYDGWRYPRGFHAHTLKDFHPRPCEENGPHPSPNIWKYDLPPGWEKHKNSLLIEICAFQWCSAHQHILNSALRDQHHFGVWFENLLGNESRQELDRLVNWLGIEVDDHLRYQKLEDLPPVMATHRPRRSRWFSRAALIQPQLNKQIVRDLREKLHE